MRVVANLVSKQDPKNCHFPARFSAFRNGFLIYSTAFLNAFMLSVTAF
jgi:hypothetical protein